SGAGGTPSPCVTRLILRSSSKNAASGSTAASATSPPAGLRNPTFTLVPVRAAGAARDDAARARRRPAVPALVVDQPQRELEVELRVGIAWVGADRRRELRRRAQLGG